MLSPSTTQHHRYNRTRTAISHQPCFHHPPRRVSTYLHSPIGHRLAATALNHFPQPSAPSVRLRHKADIQTPATQCVISPIHGFKTPSASSLSYGVATIKRSFWALSAVRLTAKWLLTSPNYFVPFQPPFPIPA